MIFTDKSKYKLLEQKQYIPLHQQSVFLDSLVDSAWEVMVYESDEEILAAFVYYKKKKAIFNYITHPDLCKWMGPIFSDKLSTSEREKILNTFLSKLPSCSYFEQNYYYNISELSLPYRFAPYSLPQYSYVLDHLGDIDKIYKGICSDYRNNKFPKAKNQVTIETRKEIDTFYALHAKSFIRQKIAVPYTVAYFRKHTSSLLKAGKAKLFFAVDSEENIHSVAMLCWDEKCAYYHIAGDDPVFRKSGSGVYLAWHLIQYASTNLGLKKFDFEGSMIPGIERVRKNFGARKMGYVKVKKYNSPFFKMLSTLKNRKKS